MVNDVALLWKVPDFDTELGSPFEFWNSTKRWPLTPSADGVVFLPVAMHRIARATYPDWHTREPWIPVPPENFMHKDLDPRALQNIRDARRLIENFADGIKATTLSTYEMAAVEEQSPAKPISLLPLSDAEWSVAKGIADELRVFVAASNARWIELVEGTFAFLRFGKLESVLRPRAGGEYRAPPAGLWNTELEQVAGRFAFCDLDLSAPFNAAARSMKEPHRIFVTVRSLDTMVAEVTALKSGGQVPAQAAHQPTFAQATSVETSFAPRRKGEKASDFKRRAMQAAWDKAFPDGIPGNLQNPARNYQLNLAINGLAGLKPIGDRDWSRMINGK
jgi:hypothetical protein